MELTPELARITAHICADGYIYRSHARRSAKEQIDHPRKSIWKNTFGVRYTNYDSALVQRFKADVMKAFNRKVVDSTKDSYDLSGKWIYELLVSLGAGKSHSWFISEEIMNSHREIKTAWLRAFFDDEAYIAKERNTIIINCVNRGGLMQIKKLLDELGIISKIYGPYYYKQFFIFRLTLSNHSMMKYKEFIGFDSPDKKRRLDEIIKKCGDMEI